MSQVQVPRYPLDKTQLGNASWKILHSYAAQYPDNPTVDDKKEFHSLLKAVIRTIPEGDCKCRSHAVEYIQKHPPNMSNRKELVSSLCEFHNDVNTRSAKPTIDCTELIKNTGECPSCKIKITPDKEKKEKAVIAADKDGPLKTVMGNYKQLSIKVFEELCKRENLPTPKIVFAPCPSATYTSCTTFLVDKDKAVIKEGQSKEPIVYINPSNFGLRVLAHEYFEYQRQMKSTGHYKPKDEDAVEKETRTIIQKYFPADYYDYEKEQVVQPLVMKDETLGTTDFKIKRESYRSRFSTDEFPMFSKYRDLYNKPPDENEASKSESGGLLSYFDSFYEPFAKYMNISARDLNLANTPNIFAEGSKIAINSQFTTFGSIVATSALGLILYVATALNKDGISIADRRLLAQLGGQFLWSGLQNASSPEVRQAAGEIGGHVANMDFDSITPLLVNDNSFFAGMTAQQQRAQQRATGVGGTGSSVGSRSGTGRGISQSVVERTQQRTGDTGSPESIETFRDVSTGAGGFEPKFGAVPRVSEGGAVGFSWNPPPSSGLSPEEREYLIQQGYPVDAI